MGKISSSLSGYQITGNPAHINREAKEKEGRRREGGRTEDEEQRMREFGSGHISCLPHSSFPPSPTDRTRTTDNNHHHSSTQCRGRAQDLGEHDRISRGNILPNSEDTILYRVMFLNYRRYRKQDLNTLHDSIIIRRHSLACTCYSFIANRLGISGSHMRGELSFLSPLPVQCHRISGAPSVKIIVLP